jgi:hypothetical protein
MRGILIALALTLAAVPVWAQTTAPAPLTPEAQEAVHKGVIAAKQQDYLLAIRFFQDARKAAPDAPEIYYDLGLAESKIPGRELRAIAWFGAYLAANPNAPNAPAVNDEIAALDVRIQSDLVRLLKIAQDLAQRDDERDVSRLAVVWAKAGDIPSAVKTADLIQDEFMRTWVWINVATALVQLDNLAGAQEIAARIRSSSASAKEEPLFLIAKAQAQAGNIVGAKAAIDLIFFVAKAQAQAGNTVGAEAATNLIFWIAAAQAQAGDIAGAKAATDLIFLIAKAQAQAGDIAGAKKTASSIQAAQSRIATAQAQAGDISSALKTVDLFQETSSKDGAWTGIARFQAIAGDTAGAQRTVDLIQDADHREDARSDIAYNRIRVGDIAGAQRTADLIQKAASKRAVQVAIAGAQAKGDPAAIRRFYSNEKRINEAKWWLRALDDDSRSTYASLNQEEFLDLSGYLKSLPPSEPWEEFGLLIGTTEIIVNARNYLHRELIEQAISQARN